MSTLEDVPSPLDGGDSPRRGGTGEALGAGTAGAAMRSAGGGGGGRPGSKSDTSSYRPPLWSMSFGAPHGQWLHKDGSARKKLNGGGHVANDVLNTLEYALKTYLFEKVKNGGRVTPSDRKNLAPEARAKLHQELTKAVLGKEQDKSRITCKEFLDCINKRFVLRNYSKEPAIKGGRSEMMVLDEDQAAAWFMKVGHDNKGRMPIDVFVRRLFTAEAHVMSLEGSREGAFPRDKSRKYTDYTWKWQGMLQHAPRFAKTGVYAPTDWEEYATKACKLSEEAPEGALTV